MASWLPVGKKIVFGLTALILLLSPSTALADDAGSTGATTPPSSSDSSSTQSTDPTADAAAAAAAAAKKAAAAAKIYHYNTTTGKWENDTYIWDPVTGQTTAKGTSPYTYDTNSGKWNTPDWQYDPTAGNYVKPAPPVQPAADSGTAADNATTTNNLTDTTNANVNNGLVSSALTGNASIIGNGLAGNALTGNASILSNTINLLQSGVNVGGNTILPTTLVANINGGTGNVTLDPSLLVMLQPAGNCCSSNTTNNVNVQQNGQIANNINLDAGSGNAEIIGNGQAGDATSGSADAVANVINLANSSISAGGSFLGVININGDLNGNILLPQSLMEHILASNAPSSSNTNTDPNSSNSLNANINNNQSIDNNVTAAASSGAATLDMNGQAGNATTGDATTNVTLLNLTGHKVIGSNSLLVFVNVLGKWTGLIMDAPAGATAAELGGGDTTCGCGGNNDTTVKADTNTGIVNNIDVAAHSGDATVAGNGKAGNATTGDASASVNLLNISNSQLSLTDWFGVIFINVFGSWNGSFCANPTECPDPATSNSPGTGGGTNSNSTTVTASTGGLAQAAGQVKAAFDAGTDTGASSDASNDSNGNVLGSTTTNHHSGPTSAKTPKLQTAKKSFGLVIAGVCCSTLLLLIERILAVRKTRLALLAAQAQS